MKLGEKVSYLKGLIDGLDINESTKEGKVIARIADILQDMIAGLTPEQQYAALTIIDRREAIKTASALAQPGDVILIAGKGHEDYQEIKGVKHHFDDKEEVEKIFAAQQNA